MKLMIFTNITDKGSAIIGEPIIFQIILDYIFK